MKAKRDKLHAILSARVDMLRDACEEVLESLDVGGEQSRAFAREIHLLRCVIYWTEE